MADSNGTTGENAFDGEELWRHSSPKSTRMWKFIEHVNEKYKTKIDSYADLHKWSVENIAAFWGEVWHFTGVRASKPYDQVRLAV